MIPEFVKDRLVQAARAVLPNACAGYSRFPVAAALLTDAGRIFTGVNIESASYGATICAERTALVKALSEGERRFVALVVVTPTERITPPCGICRQMLHEYAPDIDVLCVSDGETIETTLAVLLPFPFDGGHI